MSSSLRHGVGVAQVVALQCLRLLPGNRRGHVSPENPVRGPFTKHYCKNGRRLTTEGQVEHKKKNQQTERMSAQDTERTMRKPGQNTAILRQVVLAQVTASVPNLTPFSQHVSAWSRSDIIGFSY